MNVETNLVYKQTNHANTFRPYFKHNHINGNLYAYAANNPVHYIDPDGNDIKTVYFGGGGGKLIAGADLSAGIAWDDNGNVAIAITGNLGIGLEAKVDLPFAPSANISEGKNLDDLKGIGSFKLDGDISENGLETNLGIGFGLNLDNETAEISGWNIGTVGGGVTFASGTLYILLKHGIGDLKKQYNKLDEAQKKEFIQELKNSDYIPQEKKQNILPSLGEEEL